MERLGRAGTGEARGSGREDLLGGDSILKTGTRTVDSIGGQVGREAESSGERGQKGSDVLPFQSSSKDQLRSDFPFVDVKVMLR